MSIGFLIQRPGETLNSIRTRFLDALYGNRRAIYKPEYGLKDELEIARNAGILRFKSKKDFILGRYSLKGIPDFLKKPDKDFEEVYVAWKVGRKV